MVDRMDEGEVELKLLSQCLTQNVLQQGVDLFLRQMNIAPVVIQNCQIEALNLEIVILDSYIRDAFDGSFNKSMLTPRWNFLGQVVGRLGEGEALGVFLVRLKLAIQARVALAQSIIVIESSHCDVLGAFAELLEQDFDELQFHAGLEPTLKVLKDYKDFDPLGTRIKLEEEAQERQREAVVSGELVRIPTKIDVEFEYLRRQFKAKLRARVMLNLSPSMHPTDRVKGLVKATLDRFLGVETDTGTLKERDTRLCYETEVLHNNALLLDQVIEANLVLNKLRKR